MGYHFTFQQTATFNLCLIYFKISWTLAILLDHMHKKFEINRTKIKYGCQSGRKVVTQNSRSDLPLCWGKGKRKNISTHTFASCIKIAFWCIHLDGIPRFFGAWILIIIRIVHSFRLLNYYDIVFFCLLAYLFYTRNFLFIRNGPIIDKELRVFHLKIIF